MNAPPGQTVIGSHSSGDVRSDLTLEPSSDFEDQHSYKNYIVTIRPCCRIAGGYWVADFVISLHGKTVTESDFAAVNEVFLTPISAAHNALETARACIDAMERA